MKTSKLLIAGMVISQTLTFQAHAGLKFTEDFIAKAKAAVEKKIKEDAEAKQAAQQKPAAKPAAKPVAKPAEKPAPIPVVVVPETKKEAHNPTSTKDTDGDQSDIKVISDELHEQNTDFVNSMQTQQAEQAAQSLHQATSFDLQQAISFGFMHTKQDCKITEPSGLQHQPTYCAMEDTQAATELSGMVKAINEQLDSVKDNAATAQVSVAYFSFSNKGVQRKLCELSKAGVSIRVFLDGGSAGNIDALVMDNPDCKDASGKLNVRLSYLGGHTDGGAGGIWRLHHNKFLMIDPGNGEKVKLNFSSGNLSTFGTSLHLDHWVTMEAPRNSNIIKAQKCVMQGLEKAADINENAQSGQSSEELDQAITQGYISTRESCFDQYSVKPRVSGGNVDAQIAQMLQREEIAPLFSPNNNSYVERAFISALNKIPSGGYIYIAIQHFLHGGVKSALLSAANRGVDVRLIMDDDALKGESEVPGVDKMIADLVQMSGGKIQVRLAETNHNAGGNGSMMHNKLAILNGQMSFSGAGHYTNAALRNNWENFYFVTNKTVLKSYAQYFKYLWSVSVDINYTKTAGQTPSQSPSQLSAKFLQLAE